MDAELVAALRAVPLLADLDAADLAWIAAQGDVVALAPGDVLFRPGDEPRWMYVIVAGAIEARREASAPGLPVWSFRAGDLTGIVPFSRMRTTPSTGRAVGAGETRVFRFPRERFDALLTRLPVLEARFVAFLADRVRDATRRDQQFEKLTALGRLSAGLAHELNNPAAAARRSAAEARARVADAPRLAAALTEALASATADGPADDAPDPCALARDASAVHAALRARATPRAGEDALDRADREQAIGERLAALLAPRPASSAAGAVDPWTLAPAFTDLGLDADAVAAVLAPLPPAVRAPAAAWAEATLTADALLADVERAAARIAELVQAIKTYTHMDRGRAPAPVDVRAGLDSTLALLAHKLRDRKVTLARVLDDALPAVPGWAGELNQVWTNLLDNAIDAAAEGPTPADPRVGVRAWAEDGHVAVAIEDNGPGVPEELRARIWEPFFTTKDVGRGTGLGLDIARHIVVEQHGGALTLDTRPGATRFLVRLPVARA